MVVFEDTVGNGPLFFSGQLREHFFEVQVVRDSKPSWVAENEMPLVREFELIEEREYASTGKDQRPTFESLYGTLPSYYDEERDGEERDGEERACGCSAAQSAAPARADRGRADARAVRIAPYDEASS
ncbi:hypothetical protein SO694_00060258 [Aureococcus anophagefferens]|uniref:Uncharacterized protein n=1 Tax=Aureococcus anophagefferens TaxID=44056 RepID=A0ABR1FR45_AURAN